MRRYCLHCFTTLPPDSDQCPACGHSSPPSMRRRFWSRHPRHRQDERAAKVGALLFVIAVGGAIVLWVARGPATGPGAGWLIALPAALGAALWSTAEKITHHGANFRPAVFWGALGAVSVALLAWLGLWLAAGLAALLTIAILVACRAGQRWKHALMEGSRAP